jgi:hypothetical protein
MAENIEAGGRSKPTWWFSANRSKRAGKRRTDGYKSAAPKKYESPDRQSGPG